MIKHQGIFPVQSGWRRVKWCARHGCITNGPFGTQAEAMRSYVLAVAVLGPNYAGETAE